MYSTPTILATDILLNRRDRQAKKKIFTTSIYFIKQGRQTSGCSAPILFLPSPQICLCLGLESWFLGPKSTLKVGDSFMISKYFYSKSCEFEATNIKPLWGVEWFFNKRSVFVVTFISNSNFFKNANLHLIFFFKTSTLKTLETLLLLK